MSAHAMDVFRQKDELLGSYSGANCDLSSHPVCIVRRQMASDDQVAGFRERVDGRARGARRHGDLTRNDAVACMGPSLVSILIGLVAEEELVIDGIVIANDEANRGPGGELERSRIEARVIDVDGDNRLLRFCGQGASPEGEDTDDEADPHRGPHSRETSRLLPMRITTSIATPMIHAQTGVDSARGTVVAARA